MKNKNVFIVLFFAWGVLLMLDVVVNYVSQYDMEERITDIEQSIYKSELTWENSQQRIQEIYILYESIAHNIDSIKQVTIVRERLKAMNDLEKRIAALEKSGMVTDTISFNDLESDTVTSEYFSLQRPIRIRIVNEEEKSTTNEE